jgi:hypothetical protein
MTTNSESGIGIPIGTIDESAWGLGNALSAGDRRLEKSDAYSRASK